MIDLAALGLREYLLIAVVLAGGFFLLSLLPLLRMSGKGRPAATPPDVGEAPVSQVEDDRGQARRDEIRHEPVVPQFVPDSGGAVRAVAAEDFSRELAASSRDLELRRLRGEMDRVLADVARLSEEVSALRASRNVSPHYSEAMTLAREGETPDEIAERCGISIGEAELVAALALGRSGAEHDGADGGRYLDQGHRDG